MKNQVVHIIVFKYIAIRLNPRHNDKVLPHITNGLKAPTAMLNEQMDFEFGI